MASETGKPIQVVVANQDQTGFSLDEDALRSLLERPDVIEKNVVVVSVAGAFRLGKSFLLSFMPRFIEALGRLKPEDIKRGDWMGDESQALSGFNWRGGHKKDTTGIWFWNEPFFQKLSTGEEVVILLMDSQGAFDNQTTPKDCATVFALSALISSVQVYNLSGRIQENDLQHLQYFTQYGLAVKNDESELNVKPFQRLVFLVRDWTSIHKQYGGHEHGSEGGKAYLSTEILKVSDNQDPTLKQLREDIKSTFNSLECFLMPKPGDIDEIQSPRFDGRVSSLSPLFKTHLTQLLTSILSRENLTAKEINGRKISARELLEYIKGYMKIFQEGSAPQVGTIFMITAEMNHKNALDEARNFYKTSMDQIFGKCMPYMEPDLFQGKQSEIQEQAIEKFTVFRKLGGKPMSDANLINLKKDIEYELSKFEQQNESKRSNFLATTENNMQQTVARATTFYTENVEKIFGKDAPYLQSENLEDSHDDNHGSALDYFERTLNSISGEERSEYLQKLREEKKEFYLNMLKDCIQKLFENYRLANDKKKENFSDKTEKENYLASTKSTEFFMDEMEKKCGDVMPYLPPNEFISNGRQLLELALDKFKKYPRETKDERSDYLKSLGKETKEDFFKKVKETLQQNYAMRERQNETKLTLYLATTERNITNAVATVKTSFTNEMEQTCGTNTPFLPPDDFDNNYRKIFDTAMEQFEEIMQKTREEPNDFLRQLRGEKEASFLNTLKNDFQNLFHSYRSYNENKKTMFLIKLEKTISMERNQAINYYMRKMNQAIMEKMLWLTDAQLKIKHDEITSEAIKRFKKATAENEKTAGEYLERLAYEEMAPQIDSLQNGLKDEFEIFKDQNNKNYETTKKIGVALGLLAATLLTGGGAAAVTAVASGGELIAGGVVGGIIGRVISDLSHNQPPPKDDNSPNPPEGPDTPGSILVTNAIDTMIKNSLASGIVNVVANLADSVNQPEFNNHHALKGENVRSILKEATTSESDSDDECHKRDHDI